MLKFTRKQHRSKPDAAADLPPGRRTAKGAGLQHLLSRIFNTPLLIHPEKAEIILATLGPRLGLAAVPILSWQDDDDDDDQSDPGTDDALAANQGIAVIPVYGTLVKRGNMLAYSGMTSYPRLQAEVSAALANPACKAIVLDVDSPGGESAGMFAAADSIAASRGEKPIIAIANDAAYSAAMGIASAADRVLVTNVGGTGSIGCYMLHCDMSQSDEKNGLKYTYIFSGAHKIDGNPHQPLSDEAYATAKKEVDRVRGMFVQLVAQNRNVDAQALDDTEAACFMGPDSCPMLADEVGSLSDAIAMALEMASGSRSILVPRSAGLIFSGPIAPHKTATSDKPWDGPANEASLKLGQPSSYYRKACAWVDSKADAPKKASYKFIHHEVSEAGSIGAANVKGCQSGIGVLNGARGGADIPAGDRKGIYDHLAKHLRDAGVEPAPLKSAAKAADGCECDCDACEAGNCSDCSNPECDDLHCEGCPMQEEDRDSKKSERRLILRLRNAGAWSDYQFTDGRLLAFRGFGTLSLAGEPGKQKLLSGVLAPYDSLSSDLGGFREVYQPGCFAESLKADDPLVVYNHNSDFVLGRKSAGTARFWEEPNGLHYEVDLPDTQDARDLAVRVGRKDIRGSSAAFYILSHRWEQRSGIRTRIVEKARLVEGSPCAFPAYESSTAIAVDPSQQSATHDLELIGARLQLLKLT